MGWIEARRKTAWMTGDRLQTMLQADRGKTLAIWGGTMRNEENRAASRL